jgi:hypothetical protein
MKPRIILDQNNQHLLTSCLTHELLQILTNTNTCRAMTHGSYL